MLVERRVVGFIVVSGETCSLVSELEVCMKTKLRTITQRSVREPDARFDALMHHINEETLKLCFDRLNGRRAVGIDGIQKEDYGRRLEANLKGLMERMRRMGYRPAPVREVMIPKEGKSGAFRPLGISNFEDKMFQMRMADILQAIYEPLFLDFSYGFRPGRNCHQAIKSLQNIVYSEPVTTVVDIDFKNYFNSIDHDWLMKMLEYKIRDRKFLRYVKRMLIAGVLSEGECRITDEGTPQGSIVSPVLSNIFLHHVLDEWFEKVVKKHCRGKAWLVRYADDAVACFEYESDAKRYARALPKRAGKFGLEIHAEKSHLLNFTREKPPKQSGSFDFLGFTFYMKKSRKGYTIPALKTSRKKFCAKLKRVKEWMQKVKDKGNLHGIWNTLRSKLRGHINYYGVSHNVRSVHNFVQKAKRIVFKWLNRRSQKKSYNWDQFQKFVNQYPLPIARVVHPLFDSPKVNDKIVSRVR